MKLDAQDRLVPKSASDGRSFWFAALAVVVVCVAAAVAAVPQARDTAKSLVFAVGETFGVRPDDGYSAVYHRLGLAPLPAKLLGSSQISSGLARLAREPCDKSAIFAFGEALLSAHEERRAADAYAAFAGSCPNGEGEQYRAARSCSPRRHREGDRDCRRIGRQEPCGRALIAICAARRSPTRSAMPRPSRTTGARSSCRKIRAMSANGCSSRWPISMRHGSPVRWATTILAWIAIEPLGPRHHECPQEGRGIFGARLRAGPAAGRYEKGSEVRRRRSPAAPGRTPAEGRTPADMTRPPVLRRGWQHAGRQIWDEVAGPR